MHAARMVANRVALENMLVVGVVVVQMSRPK